MLDELAGVAQSESMAADREHAAAPQAPAGFPLTLAREDDDLIIAAMHGGRHYRRQLMDMGLRPGGRVRVLRAANRGPVLVLVGETRLGIGRGMAEKIEVVPVARPEGK